MDFDVVIEKCRTGEFQFHDMPDACAVTHIGVSGQYRTLYVLAAAGELDALPALAEKLMAFGREHGCGDIETEGRLGFDPICDKICPGAKKISVRYRKEL